MRQQILNLFTTPRDMSWEDILLNIVLAAVLGFFIFLSYAISHRGTIYSRKFNASLVILAVLTGTVMTVIGNNIALSLGMVGALSIVRFRTAVKDPVDTVFMFWAITAGIMSGAVLSWITCINELSSSIMLYSGKTSTIAVAIYQEVVRMSDGTAAALATILTVTTIISLVIVFRATKGKVKIV